MNRKTIIFSILYLVGFAHGIVLAGADDSLRVYELDPLVITGTRIERQKSEIPASITVLGRQTIEKYGVTNLLPALSFNVPGLFLNTRNPVGLGIGPESSGNIVIRGVGGTPNTQILMLIDGQPQFVGLFGHPIPDTYMSSDVERMEVIRGPASILYGSNAMGGAINLITRQPREGFTGRATMAYGSYNTRVFSGKAGYSKGRLSSLATFNAEATDGYRTDRDDSFRNYTGFLKLGYRISRHLNATIDGNMNTAEFNNPGPVGLETPNIEKREFTRGRAALSLDSEFGKVEGALRLFYNYGKHDFSGGFNSRDFNKGITFYQNIRYHGRSTLTLGVDYKNFGGTANNRNTPPNQPVGFDVEQSINETDVYALMQHHFGERVSANLGYRLINNSVYGTEHVPAAGISFRAVESTILKAAVSKGFRSPTIVDAFLFPVSNDTLRPERLWNYEVGIQQFLFDNRLSAELTGFIIDGDNLIQTVVVSAPPPVKINTGAFTNKGLELAMNYKISDTWRAVLNYAFLNLSNPVQYAPEHSINAHASYSKNWLSAMLGLQYNHNLWVVPPNPSANVAGEQTNYTLVNLRVDIRPKEWFSVFVEGNNLLNQEYQIDKGYPMPRINYLTGLSFGIQ